MILKYKSLVARIFKEQIADSHTKVNLELLCDIETFIGLTCIMQQLNVCKAFANLHKVETSSFVICVYYQNLAR
jgi:hypothetical protein